MSEDKKTLPEELRQDLIRSYREAITPDPVGTRRWPRQPVQHMTREQESRLLLNECLVALRLDELGKVRPDANTRLLERIDAFLKRTA